MQVQEIFIGFLMDTINQLLDMILQLHMKLEAMITQMEKFGDMMNLILVEKRVFQVI